MRQREDAARPRGARLRCDPSLCPHRGRARVPDHLQRGRGARRLRHDQETRAFGETHRSGARSARAGALPGGAFRPRGLGRAPRRRSEALKDCAAKSPLARRLRCAEMARRSRVRSDNKNVELGEDIMASLTRRRALRYGAAGATMLGLPSIVRAQSQVVRIGLPTKTYYPTIIAE